jgi:hypothetical protein
MTAIKTDKSVWVDGILKNAEYIPLARALGIEEVCIDQFGGRAFIGAIIANTEQELTGQGLVIQNNKASVLTNPLGNKDGWTVLKAGEVISQEPSTNIADSSDNR